MGNAICRWEDEQYNRDDLSEQEAFERGGEHESVDSSVSQQLLGQSYNNAGSSDSRDDTASEKRVLFLDGGTDAAQVLYDKGELVHGSLSRADGSIYKGQFGFGNVRHGQGTQTYANGQSYEGEWREHKRCGQGKFVYGPNDFYEGAWTNSLRNGLGTHVFPDGSNYRGNYVNDQMHGQGKFSWSNGSYYEGQFEHNKYSGTGFFFFAKEQDQGAATYQGEFKNNLKHGQGVFTWKDDEASYVGSFVDGKKCGRGKLTTCTLVYEGEWKDDGYCGQGVLIETTTSKSSSSSGANRELCEEEGDGGGARRVSVVTKYEGVFEQQNHHEFSGNGTITLANGNEYRGMFKHDRFIDGGVLTFVVHEERLVEVIALRELTAAGDDDEDIVGGDHARIKEDNNDQLNNNNHNDYVYLFPIGHSWQGQYVSSSSSINKPAGRGVHRDANGRIVFKGSLLPSSSSTPTPLPSPPPQQQEQ